MAAGDPDLIRGLTADERRQTARELAAASPAGLAYVHTTRGLDPELLEAGQAWMPAPHLLLIADRLVRIRDQVLETQRLIAARELPPDTQGPRLMVFMPPRHGKSMLISQYTPAWFLGACPTLRAILCSYGADLATVWGRRSRDVLEDMGAELYGVKVSQASAAAKEWEIEGTLGGLVATGIGGAITGKGAHLMIVDDPVKDAADAASETIQAKTWDWWQGTARTRLMPGGAVVVLQTRWHERDLSGRLLAEDPTRDTEGRLLPDDGRRDDVDGESWEVLCLPAIAEKDHPLQDHGDELHRQPGEALWPQMYGAGALALIRRAVGSYNFVAQYQQRPTPAEGGIFKRAGFAYFTEDPERDCYWLYPADGGPRWQIGRAWCYRFMTIDPAFSEKQTADYTAMGMWAVTPAADLLLLDMTRIRFEVPDLTGQIRAHIELHRPTDVRIEKQAYGAKVIENLVREGLPILPLDADTDKVTRAMGAVPRYEAGAVFHRKGAQWVPDYERELLSFPNGSNDDQVDVFSHAAACLPGIVGARGRSRGGAATVLGGLATRDL